MRRRTIIYRQTTPEKQIFMSKNDLLILACSPRKGGNSDYAALSVFREAAELGFDPDLLYLRDYHVLPCAGCRKCSLSEDFSCILDSKDEAGFLLSRISKSRVVCFCSPIFFYHLPAGLKCLIDRGQSYYERWARVGSQDKTGKALCVLVAGRKKGDALFKGSLLTLKYFFDPFNLQVSDLCLRGQDETDDLKKDSAACAMIEKFVRSELGGEKCCPRF